MSEKLITLQHLQTFKSNLETLIEGYVEDITEKDDAQDVLIQDNKDRIDSLFTILDKLDGTEDGKYDDLATQLTNLRNLLAEFEGIADVSDWIAGVNNTIQGINTAIGNIGIGETNSFEAASGKFISKIVYNPTTKKFTITDKALSASDMPSGIGLDKMDYSSITKDGTAATSFSEAVQMVSPPCDFSTLDGSETGETPEGDGVVVSRVTETDGKVTTKYKKLAIADLPARFGDNDTDWATTKSALLQSMQTAINNTLDLTNASTRNAGYYQLSQDVSSLKTIINEFVATDADGNTITDAINTLQEVYAFLAQYKDDQNLGNILATLESSLQTYASTAASTAAGTAQSNAEANAKTYTDGEIGKLDYAGNAIGTGEIISDVTETDGKISVSKRSLAKADIPSIDMSQVNGLSAALANVQSALTYATDAEIRSLFTADTQSMVSLSNVE